MGKMFTIYGIFGKSSKPVDGFFFTRTNIMCQILSRSDILKKKVGYLTHKKDIKVFIVERYGYLDRGVRLLVKFIR